MKLIIFDIDGTLINSVDTYHKVVINAMTGLGIKDIDTNFNDLEHHTDSYALKYNYENNFNTTLSPTLLNEFENFLVQYLMKEPVSTCIKGAKEIIAKLQNENICIAFATGALPKAALFKMKQADLWIDEKILATSKTSYSREGFVLEAIDLAKKYYTVNSFEKIISVGDGLWDLKTAENLNLEFIGIGLKNKELMLKNGMQYWFEDFTSFDLNII